MNLNSHEIEETNVRRQSTIKEGQHFDRRFSKLSNIERRLSTISQLYLPYGVEYHRQERIPPSGLDFQPEFLLKHIEDSDERRFSIISHPIEEDFVTTKTKEHHRKILFIVEPIIISLIIFPIIVLFWQCGWNIVSILLNLVNGYPLDGHQQISGMEESRSLANSPSLFESHKIFWKRTFGKEFSGNMPINSKTRDKKRKGLSRPNHSLIGNNDSLILNIEGEDYSFSSLFIPYVIIQLLLLCFYLFGDYFYEFVKKQNKLLKIVFLKCDIFILASIYIIQWEVIWTIFDQYTPAEWYFELILSLISLFLLITLVGH